MNEIGRSAQPFLLPPHNQAAAQRGAVHGDGFPFGKLDAVAVLNQILRLALADFAHLADRALEEVALIAAVAAGRRTGQ